MPVAVSYPGVYIEEIPSGVRTIAGVPTSIAAFIGRAKRGPSDLPVLINSFSDFERVFGGLWVDGSLGYAVRDFYLNGGGQGARAETILEFERRYLERLMAACQGNETSAAKRAGKERRALGKLLKRHGLQRADFSPPGAFGSAPTDRVELPHDTPG